MSEPNEMIRVHVNEDEWWPVAYLENVEEGSVLDSMLVDKVKVEEYRRLCDRVQEMSHEFFELCRQKPVSTLTGK